jgi:hypothetical protein
MSGQVAFHPTNGRRSCILCDQWLGKGGFTWQQCLYVVSSMNGGGGRGRDTNKSGLYLFWPIGSAISLVL